MSATDSRLPLEERRKGAILRITTTLFTCGLMLSGRASYWVHGEKGQAEFDEDYAA
jgi:hypothetical protein